MKKIILIIGFAAICAFTLMGTQACGSDAQLASQNLSTAADQFEIFRRVVFYNGITDEYILVIEGYCSLDVDTVDDQLEITVKTGPGEFKKHFLGLSDNVTYFAEQLSAAYASTARYRVIFKPSTIIPNIDLE